VVEEHVLIRTILIALLIASPASAESWSTAMTPLDPRPPLPKPSEPDADNNNDGPFHAPAPAVVRTSAKKPVAKPKAAARPDCKCEPCLCAREVEVEPRLEPVAETPRPKAKATPKPKAAAPEDDPRLTRNAQGYYFGTASNGSVYYSTVAADVLACLDNPPAPQPVRYYSRPATTDYFLGSFGGASCATGNCPR